MSIFSLRYKDSYVEVIVDEEDLNRVKAIPWYYRGNTGYIGTTRQYGNVKLHRYILGNNDPRIYVEHINNNKLDNRKSNLRTYLNHNKLDNKSCYKGVHYVKNINMYQARICLENTKTYISLGNFTTAEEAARIYDDVARKYYGVNAIVNFPAN